MSDIDPELIHSLIGSSDRRRVPCPACSNNRRRHNQKLPILSLTRTSEGVLYRCHHCPAKGIALFKKQRDYTIRIREGRPVQASQPTPKKTKLVELDQLPQGLSDHDLEYLKNRGIEEDIARASRLYSGRRRYFPQLKTESDCIAFPWLSEGARRCEAVKYRAHPSKAFAFWGGTTNLYKPCALKAGEHNNASPMVLTEGEIDALSIASADTAHGFSVYSLPHGAQSVECIAAPANRQLISSVPALILAGDNDSDGITSMRKIAVTSGAREIRRVIWPDNLKDASEVAMALGHGAILDAIENAKLFDIDDFEGMASAGSYMTKIGQLYDGALGHGYKVGIEGVDNLYSVPMGYMTVLTGWPNDGKSQFLANMLVNLALKSGLKTAIWAPEEGPESYISKLIEIKEGAPFFGGPNVVRRLDQATVGSGVQWVDENFVFLTQEHGQSASIESILERLDIAVRVRGCRLIVIDPYNYIDKRYGGDNEVEWIRTLLITLKRWVQSRGCHLFLVAHPKQLPNGHQRFVPTGFHISGGSPWNAITDFGMTVYRVNPQDNASTFSSVEIHLWKVRQKWHGRRGFALLDYDRASGRYYGALSAETIGGAPVGVHEED